MLNLQRTLRTGPAAQVATFVEQVYVGTIGGAALGTDANPNTSAPSAGRIARATKRPGCLAVTGAEILYVLCVPIAAANITIQLWLFDATQAKWLQFSTAQTITPTGGATNNSIFASTLMFYGQQCFAQITANANVQALSYGFV